MSPKTKPQLIHVFSHCSWSGQSEHEAWNSPCTTTPDPKESRCTEEGRYFGNAKPTCSTNDPRYGDLFLSISNNQARRRWTCLLARQFKVNVSASRAFFEGYSKQEQSGSPPFGGCQKCGFFQYWILHMEINLHSPAHETPGPNLRHVTVLVHSTLLGSSISPSTMARRQWKKMGRIDRNRHPKGSIGRNNLHKFHEFCDNIKWRFLQELGFVDSTKILHRGSYKNRSNGSHCQQWGRMPSRQFRHLQNQPWRKGSQEQQGMLVFIQLNAWTHSTSKAQNRSHRILLLVSVGYLVNPMTIPFGEHQPSDGQSSQLFTPRLRKWLDERLRHLASQQRIQDARALRSEFSIEELSTRWLLIRCAPSESSRPVMETRINHVCSGVLITNRHSSINLNTSRFKNRQIILLKKQHHLWTISLGDPFTKRYRDQTTNTQPDNPETNKNQTRWLFRQW